MEEDAGPGPDLDRLGRKGRVDHTAFELGTTQPASFPSFPG